MTLRRFVLPAACLSLFAVSGCKDDHSHPPAAKSPEPAAGKPAIVDPHEGGPLALGEAAAGPYTIKAGRDAGPLKPGGEGHIDVDVTGAPFAAVRVWIGAADGKGSMKGKGEVEFADRPNHRHAHAEVPDPLAPDAKLYVEVEAADGAKHVASFDLKR
jgi:hypothetical protein